MATILIFTQVADKAALAVATVLQGRGHRCIRWFGADFPSRTTSTVVVDPTAGFSWKARDPEVDFDSDIDIVWLRRMQWPYVPADALHPDDTWLAEQEARQAHDAIWLTLGEHVRWVNPPQGAQRAFSKVLQLKLAREIGFDIPDTIASNDPGEIRAFLERHREQGTVYKSSVPAAWRSGDGTAVLGTSRVTAEDLPSDVTLRLAPAIFQEWLPKAHELRVTFMGSHNVALRIFSQEQPEAKLDWRFAPMSHLSTELCTLPEQIEANCMRLMKRLGIVFGCFDFVVTPEGRIVFLEVNEAGQFLFVESLHPSSRLLDAFCEFLLSPSIDFKPRFEHEHVNIDDVMADPSFKERWRHDAKVHLTRPRPWLDREQHQTSPPAPRETDR